ncbi:MAG: CHAT domain-containing protein [Planctomycetes bacterium]|nr:CHAT domain-containing protein [Planctomycetota bacterium]
MRQSHRWDAAGGSRVRCEGAATDRRAGNWRITAAVLAAVWCGGIRSAPAQSGSYPSTDYFVAMQVFTEGEYRSAAKAFQTASRSGLRGPNWRWIDSVCYYTMLGECFYHMGDHANALEQYNLALRLFLSQREWLQGVRFQETNAPPYTGPVPTWGTKGRAAPIGPFPEKGISSPRALNSLAVSEQGTAVLQTQYVSLYAGEVARCIAVSLRRRAEILGPVGPHDPMTREIIAGLSPSPAPPNHWTQAWVDCWLGLAYLSANRAAEASASLQSSLTAGGNFDHALTSIGLLELGKLAVAAGQFEQAEKYLFESTFPATYYGQYDVLEEAFRWGSWNHLVAGRPEPYAMLGLALPWAQRQSLIQLEASLLLESAEQVGRADAKAGLAALELGRRAMLRHEMMAGAIGARYQFLFAKLQYQAGNIAAGDTALATAMKFYAGAPNLVQIGFADRLAGSLTELAADTLYASVLREPTPMDWALRPAESLAMCLNANTAPFEHWFELAVKRSDLEKAIEVVDRIRRKQFMATTTMGGRLLALRWVLDGPEEVLSETGKLQRLDLFARYPAFQALSRRSDELRAELASMPIVPTEPADVERQRKAYAELGRVSASREVGLREIAVGRNGCEFAFPPPPDLKAIRAKLDEKQAIWLFFAARRDVYSFLIRKEGSVQGRRISEAAKIRAGLVNLLRETGNHDGNYELALKDTKSPWATTSKELLRILTGASAVGEEPPWKDAEELVIVPHGVLWYLPFEMLGVDSGGTIEPLIAKVRIRYAPFVSLAVPDGRRALPIADTLLIAGKLHPKDTDSTADDVAKEMAEAVPRLMRLTDAKPPAPLLASVCSRAVVFAEIDIGKGGPFGVAPLPIEGAKGESKVDPSLASWLELPWGAPQELILPGFHTSAESALKKGGTGDEVFLAVSGLMASGCRSVLISRWRVGGMSARKLVREYLQELPHSAPANAWQRSVELFRSQELDLTNEPRVNRGTFTEAVPGDFPLFWGGYMLIDSGDPGVPRAPAAPPKDS